MANDKNKIKELVSDDDDPTLDLEHIAGHDDVSLAQPDERESDASTFGLDEYEAGPAGGNESIAELRSDLQLRAKP